MSFTEDQAKKLQEGISVLSSILSTSDLGNGSRDCKAAGIATSLATAGAGVHRLQDHSTVLVINCRPIHFLESLIAGLISWNH